MQLCAFTSSGSSDSYLHDNGCDHVVSRIGPGGVRSEARRTSESNGCPQIAQYTLPLSVLAPLLELYFASGGKPPLHRQTKLEKPDLLH